MKKFKTIETTCKLPLSNILLFFCVICSDVHVRQMYYSRDKYKNNRNNSIDVRVSTKQSSSASLTQKYKNIRRASLTSVDDVLVVAPKTTNLEEKLEELNSVDAKIQFTLEKESQGTIAFLDTEIIRENRVKFRVYRKPTNKECYVHYYSGHSDRVKRGVVLGFFLRAYRICSEEFLHDEIQHIISSFAKLKYPKRLLIDLKRKALQIRKRSTRTKPKKKDERYLAIPKSKPAETIVNQLERTGFKVSFTSGRKIGDMLKEKRKDKETDKSIVYKVPCGSCRKSYIGETGRGMEIRLREHKRDLRNHMEHSAFVMHAQKTNHLPNWDGAGILASCRSRENRKATEAAHIATNETFNIRVGFMKWAKSAAIFGIQ